MSISKAYSAWAASYDSDHNFTRDLDGEVTRDLFAGQRVPFRVWQLLVPASSQ